MEVPVESRRVPAPRVPWQAGLHTLSLIFLVFSPLTLYHLF
jgi:hypothetical protein